MEKLLEIKNIRKSFDDNLIFDDLSFDVAQGEVICIVGPSGCGKSTLLRCINALEPIQAGHITLSGQEVLYGDPTLPSLRRKIGMVFQSYDLFPHKNVLDNMTLAPCVGQKRKKADAQEEAYALLKRVRLEDKAKSYPRQLSGGQKQRVAIVRALMMHPEVLLLDEITAALDPEMVREVLDVVLDLAADKKTMLIVTHEMAFARAIADRIIFLEHTKIVEDSDPETFFDHPTSTRVQQFLQQFNYVRKDRKK